jgi:radical SAM protein with 4Fe4S-binding SPASM domain
MDDSVLDPDRDRRSKSMKAALKPRINLEGRTPLETVIPLATPFIVFIDPASSCNFKCTFCPTGHRELIAETGRYQGAMKYEVFTKAIDDLAEFGKPIKVLRMYKDGEPFLNKRLADMIRYAKKSGYVDYIDTTTNGTFLTPERLAPVIEAGLDKINISVDGMTKETYQQFTGFNFDFDKFVEGVKWLDANKGDMEVSIKIPGELITEDERQKFFDTFGDYCDRIFIENFAPCWPEFDVQERSGIKIGEKGIYQQDLKPTDTCPYIFYAMSVNADGLVSSCFLDWGRRLIIGDVREESLRQIWNSDKMNALRLQHLEGRRCENKVCGSCGQLTHCLPDNIDDHRDMLLERFRAKVRINPDVPAPGGLKRLPQVAAE